MARNAEAADAALAYCEAAVARLAELDFQRSEDFVHDWTRQGDVFVRRTRAEARIDLFGVRDELHGLPEFAAAVAAISADAQMAKQLGPRVGTGFASGRFSAEGIVDEVLRAGALANDPIRVDEGAARRAYEERECALYADTVRYTFVAPLLGLEAELLPIRAKGREGLEIDALRDEEIERCLSTWLLPFPDSPLLPVGRLVGLRASYAVPKVILPDEPLSDERFPDGSSEQAGAIFREFPTLLERLTQALGLLKAGAVGSPGYIYFADDPLDGGTGCYGVSFSARNFANYALAFTEIAQLRELWAMLSADEVVKHRTLPSAVRRFMYARDRYPPEDQLIDLMIATETLFLTGQEQDPSYRLALRSAFFLADRRPRAETFAHMKRAYTASRAIVHRSQPGTLELGDGRQVELREFVEETSELVREALAKAVLSERSRRRLG